MLEKGKKLVDRHTKHIRHVLQDFQCDVADTEFKATDIGIVLIRSLCQGLKGPPLGLSQFADSRSEKLLNSGHNAAQSLRKMLISPETMSLIVDLQASHSGEEDSE